MAMMNLRDLYVDQLRDLYSAEQQILVAEDTINREARA